MLRILLIATVLAVGRANLQTEWDSYKKLHSKRYDENEDILRRYIYQSNVKKIQEHNKLYALGKSSYMMGENQFTDWTSAEVNEKMMGLTIKIDPDKIEDIIEDVNVSDLPPSVDWRKKGYVTPVKDQGQCGSCYAFSAVGAIEGAHFKSAGKLVSLSESNVVDCSVSIGNMGCNGGWMTKVFQYVIQNKGIDTEESYPYVPKNGTCKFNRSNVGATIKSFGEVNSTSEKSLQMAVATVGPVSVAICVTDNFGHYKSGVFDDPTCSPTKLNHGVLVVGYGTEDGKDYWLVKNSWSTKWGDQGYIKMSRNKNNQCGISTNAHYPLA